MENKKALEGVALENYQAVVADLDVIVLAKPTLDLLKTNADFQHLVSKDITIVQEYEQKYEVTSENLTRFANAFQSITGKEFIPVSSININDEIETKDTIKYNRVFIKNITHLDFNDIANSLKPQTEKVETQETTKEEASQAMAAGTVGESNNNFNNGYAAGVYNKISNEATEQFINQAAVSVLNYHVAKGDVYIFQNKPKIIPILKWITIVLYGILFVLNVVALVFSILAKDVIVNKVENDGKQEILKWGDIGGALPFQIIQLLLLAMIIGMCIWSIFKSFKNENQRYKFSWGINLFYILFIFLFGMLAMGLSKALTIDSQINQIKSWNINNLDAVNNLLICVYINYAIYGILGLMVLIIVIGAICNPKRDFARIQQLVQQYANQIRSGEIDPSNYANGGFMNQFGF